MRHQRFSQIRIFPKTHVANLSQLSNEALLEVGRALAIADFVIEKAITQTKFRINAKDRSVAFRQTLDNKFHMFIDVYPVYLGFGGPELTIPLSVSTIKPESLAKSVKVYVEKYVSEIEKSKG